MVRNIKFHTNSIASNAQPKFCKVMEICPQVTTSLLQNLWIQIYLDFFHGPIPAVLPFDDLFQIPSRLYLGTPPWKDSRNSRVLSWQPLDIIFTMPHGCWVQIYYNYISIWKVQTTRPQKMVLICNYMDHCNTPYSKILRNCSRSGDSCHIYMGPYLKCIVLG